MDQPKYIVLDFQQLRPESFGMYFCGCPNFKVGYDTGPKNEEINKTYW